MTRAPKIPVPSIGRVLSVDLWASYLTVYVALGLALPVVALVSPLGKGMKLHTWLPWLAIVAAALSAVLWRVWSVRQVFRRGVVVRARVVERYRSFKDITLTYRYTYQGTKHEGRATIHKHRPLAAREEGKTLEVVVDSSSPRRSYAVESYHTP